MLRPAWGSLETCCHQEEAESVPPDPFLAHPEALRRLHPGRGAGAHTYGLHHPQAGPDEFPRRALGLEQVFPVPGPLLPSPAAKPPPRVEEPASPGPATQPEPPGPPPGQAILKAEEPLQEERSSEPMAAHLCPGTLGAPLLAQLPPAQDPSLARLPPPAKELPPHPPSATRQCRQAAPRHGLEARTRGPLPFSACQGHTTDQALEPPRDSHHSVLPAH
ncbi:uncharacterized protein AAEQ78_018809 isoform 1-T1 [Lycaon pictus]